MYGWWCTRGGDVAGDAGYLGEPVNDLRLGSNWWFIRGRVQSGDNSRTQRLGVAVAVVGQVRLDHDGGRAVPAALYLQLQLLQAERGQRERRGEVTTLWSTAAWCLEWGCSCGCGRSVPEDVLSRDESTDASGVEGRCRGKSKC